MKYYDWDELKNIRLKTHREICFEDVIVALREGGLLDVIEHPHRDKYPAQKVYVLNINYYIYLVPFVEEKDKYFLKTIYPSRKMTKKYLYRRKK